MSDWSFSLESIENSNALYSIRARYWDGCDRPEYQTVVTNVPAPLAWGLHMHRIPCDQILDFLVENDFNLELNGLSSSEKMESLLKEDAKSYLGLTTAGYDKIREEISTRVMVTGGRVAQITPEAVQNVMEAVFLECYLGNSVRFERSVLPNGCMTLIHGNAKGVDSMCAYAVETLPGSLVDKRFPKRGADRDREKERLWASIKIKAFPAQWKTLGRRAGFVRNAEMIAQNPHLVLSFPGATGTKMATDMAIKKNIPIVYVSEDGTLS